MIKYICKFLNYIDKILDKKIIVFIIIYLNIIFFYINNITIGYNKIESCVYKK